MIFINYKLIRSKVKTLRIKIKGGEVFVFAPKNISSVCIENFLETKKDWIIDKVEKQKQLKTYIDSIGDNDVVYQGKIYSLNLLDSSLDRDTFYKRERDKITNYVNSIVKKFNFKVSKISWTRAKTFWGLCTVKNEIRLNRRLAMLPQNICEYIIFHELAHTVYHNHSINFWNFLKTYIPDCKDRRKILKQYYWVLEL